MLTGDLKDFSLREVLQFLATTSSSGVLELRNVESHACVAFRGGGICLALLDMGGIHGLAARLVRAGDVDLSRLRALGAEHSGDAVDLAAALATVAAGHEGTARVFGEHTYETLGWLLRRQEAQFLFEGSAQLDDWPFDVVDLDDALAAVDERSAEWDELSDTVSDLTRVCSPVPDVSDDEVRLTADQWRVLSLVDGRRQLKHLIELSGIGHLETCRQLHDLVVAGMVELVAAGASSRLDDMLVGLDALRREERGGEAFVSEVVTHARPRDDEDAVTARVGRSDTTPSSPPTRDPHDEGTDRPGEWNGAGLAAGADELASDANRALFERLVSGGSRDA